MKKLFLFAFLIMMTSGIKAQVNNVTINNYTGADVYVVFYGDVATSGCTASYTSFLKTLVGGLTGFTVNCGNTTIKNGTLTLTTGDEIVGVDVYDANPATCTPTLIGSIGETCFSGSSSITTPYTTYDNTCTGATINSVTWNPAGPGTATLDIN